MIRFLNLLVITFLLIACDEKPTISEDSGEDVNLEPALSFQAFISPHFPNEIRVPDDKTIKERNAYTNAFDRNFRIPFLVTYMITPEFLDNPKRESRFKKFNRDPDETNPVVTGDYTNSGYARGHLVPFAVSGGDRDGDGIVANLDPNLSDPDDEVTVFEINYMSNITPQNQKCFNGAGGVWFKLERKLQKKVEDSGNTAWVAIGALLDISPEMIGPDQDIAVPTKFFKLFLMADDSEQLKSVAFLFPHYKPDENNNCPDVELTDSVHFKTIEFIENLTDIDFFADLPEDEQHTLAGQNSEENWNNLFGAQ